MYANEEKQYISILTRLTFVVNREAVLIIHVKTYQYSQPNSEQKREAQKATRSCYVLDQSSLLSSARRSSTLFPLASKAFFSASSFSFSSFFASRALARAAFLRSERSSGESF